MRKTKSFGKRIGSLALSLLMVASLISVPSNESGIITNPVVVDAASGVAGDSAGGAAAGSASGAYGNSTIFGYRVSLVAANKAVKLQQYSLDIKKGVNNRRGTEYSSNGRTVTVDGNKTNGYYWDNNVTKNVLCSGTWGRKGLFYTFGATWRMSRTDDEDLFKAKYPADAGEKAGKNKYVYKTKKYSRDGVYSDKESVIYETRPNVGDENVGFFSAGANYTFQNTMWLKDEQVYAINFKKGTSTGVDSEDVDSYLGGSLFDDSWLTNNTDISNRIKYSTDLSSDRVWLCPFFTSYTSGGNTTVTDGAGSKKLWQILNHATVNLDKVAYAYTKSNAYNDKLKTVTINYNGTPFTVSKAVTCYTDILSYCTEVSNGVYKVNEPKNFKTAILNYTDSKNKNYSWVGDFYGGDNEDICFKKIMQHLDEVDDITMRYLCCMSNINPDDKDSNGNATKKTKISKVIYQLGALGFKTSSPSWGWYNLQVEPIYMVVSKNDGKALFINGAQAALNGTTASLSKNNKYNTSMALRIYAKACATTSNNLKVTGIEEDKEALGDSDDGGVNKITALVDNNGKKYSFKVTHGARTVTSKTRDSRNKGFGSIISILPVGGPEKVYEYFCSLKHGTNLLTVNDNISVPVEGKTYTVPSTMSTVVKVTNETHNPSKDSEGNDIDLGRFTTIAGGEGAVTKRIACASSGTVGLRGDAFKGYNWFYQLQPNDTDSAFTSTLKGITNKDDYTVVSTNRFKDTLSLADATGNEALESKLSADVNVSTNKLSDMDVHMTTTALTSNTIAKGYTFKSQYVNEHSKTIKYLTEMTDRSAKHNVQPDGNSAVMSIENDTVDNTILHATTAQNDKREFKHIRDGGVYIGAVDETQVKSDEIDTDTESSATVNKHKERAELTAEPNDNDKYPKVTNDNKGKLPSNVRYHDDSDGKRCNFVWFTVNDKNNAGYMTCRSNVSAADIVEWGIRDKNSTSTTYNTGSVYSTSGREVYVKYKRYKKVVDSDNNVSYSYVDTATATKDLEDFDVSVSRPSGADYWSNSTEQSITVCCRSDNSSSDNFKITVHPVTKHWQRVTDVRYGFDTKGTIDGGTYFVSGDVNITGKSARSTECKSDDLSGELKRVLCNENGQRYDNHGNLMYTEVEVEDDVTGNDEEAGKDTVITNSTNVIEGGNVLLQKNPTVKSTFSSYYIQMDEQAAGITGMVQYHSDADYIYTGTNNNFNLQHKMFSGALLSGKVVNEGTTTYNSDGTVNTWGNYDKIDLKSKASGLAMCDSSISVSGSMCSSYLVTIPRSSEGGNVDDKDTAIARLSKVVEALNDVEDGDDQNMNHYLSGEQGADRLQKALITYANKNSLPSDYTVKFICNGLGEDQFKTGVQDKGFNDVVIGTQNGTQSNSEGQGYDVMVITVKRCNVPILSSSHVNPDEVNHVYKNIATNRDANEFAGYKYSGELDKDKYYDINIRGGSPINGTANDYEITNYVDSNSGSEAVTGGATNSNTALGSSSTPLKSYFHIKAYYWKKDDPTSDDLANGTNMTWLIEHNLKLFKARMYQYSVKVTSGDNEGKISDNANYQASFNTSGAATDSQLKDVATGSNASTNAVISTGATGGTSEKPCYVSACYLGWNTMGVLTPAETGKSKYGVKINGKSTSLTGYSDFIDIDNFREDEKNMLLSKIDFAPSSPDKPANIEPANAYDGSSRKYVVSVRPSAITEGEMSKDDYTFDGHHTYTGRGINTDSLTEALSLGSKSQAIVPSVTVPLSRDAFATGDNGVEDVTSNAANYGLFNQRAVVSGTTNGDTVKVDADKLKYAGVIGHSQPAVDITTDTSEGKTLVISAGSNTVFKWGTEIKESKNQPATAPVSATFYSYKKDEHGNSVEKPTYVNQDLTFYMIKTKLFTYRTKSHDLLLQDRGVVVTHDELTNYDTDGTFANKVLKDGSTRTQIVNDTGSSRIYLGFAEPLGKAIMFYPEVRRTAYYCSATKDVEEKDILKYEMNTVGESARTVRPIALNMLSLNIGADQLSSITTSDTVATGTDAANLMANGNGKQVIYAGGNINLNSTINEGYIKLSSYALELPDANTKTYGGAVGGSKNYTTLTGKSDTEGTALYKDFAEKYKAEHPELFTATDAEGKDVAVYTEKSIAKEEFIKWTEAVDKSLTPNLVLNLSEDTDGLNVQQSYTDFTSLKVSRNLEDADKVDTPSSDDFVYTDGTSDVTKANTRYNAYSFVVRDGMIIVDTETGQVEGLYADKDGNLCTVTLNANEYPVKSDFIQMQKDMAKDAGYTDSEISANQATKVGVTDTVKIWGKDSEMEKMFWKSQIGQELLKALISKYSDEDHSVTKSTTGYDSSTRVAENKAYKWYDEGSSVFVIKRYTRRLYITDIAVQDKLDIDAGPESSVTTSSGGTENMQRAYTGKWYLKLFLDNAIYTNAWANSDTADASKTKDAYLLGNADTVTVDTDGIGLYLGEQADFLVPNATTSDMRR